MRWIVNKGQSIPIIETNSKTKYAVRLRDELENLSKQKRVKSSGFFDYKNLIPTALFGRTYADLFRNSLGEIPKKDNFVYKNMRKSKKQCATTP